MTLNLSYILWKKKCKAGIPVCGCGKHDQQQLSTVGDINPPISTYYCVEAKENSKCHKMFENCWNNKAGVHCYLNRKETFNITPIAQGLMCTFFSFWVSLLALKWKNMIIEIIKEKRKTSIDLDNIKFTYKFIGKFIKNSKIWVWQQTPESPCTDKSPCAIY